MIAVLPEERNSLEQPTKDRYNVDLRRSQATTMMRTRLLVCLTLVFCGTPLALSWAQDHGSPPLFSPPPLAPGGATADLNAFSEPWSPPVVPLGQAMPTSSSSQSRPATEPELFSAPGELPLPQPGATSDEAPPDIDAHIASEDESSTWYQPEYWFGPTPWGTGVELGLNGSSGTSETLSIRTGGYIKRESRFSKLDLNTYYNRTTDGGVATQNNAQLDVRNDWLLDDRSPWTLYGTGNLFYDEFQAFDLQASANTGIGYRFVHEPARSIIGRLGGGASREIGGPDDRWVPESLVGFECSHQLFATQKVYAKFDYYPEFEQLGEYRLIADAGWEIELAQPSNLSLKISASDRYDSTPNGADPHLVNYSVLLLLRL